MELKGMMKDVEAVVTRALETWTSLDDSGDDIYLPEIKKAKQALSKIQKLRESVPPNLEQALKLASKDKHVWDFHQRLDAATLLQTIMENDDLLPGTEEISTCGYVE